MKIDFDSLGDMQKLYENMTSDVALMPGIPILARLDGRNFHKFTADTEKPYDESFMRCMDKTCLYLLTELNPTIVYTQSDEITLAWANDNLDVSLPFGGRFQKWCSTIAASATLYFNRMVDVHLPRYSHLKPTFDCRVWQVPNTKIAADNLLWREMDATKNSISMAASANFPHKTLEGISTHNRLLMLEGIGIRWDKYPTRIKKGAYFRKKKVEAPLSQEIWEKIPETSRPTTNIVTRNVPSEVDIPILTRVVNYEQVLFKDEAAILETQE